MLQVLSPAELAVALEEPLADLHLELPDPTDDRLSEPEFLSAIDRAWRQCERLDLQTEIWRGRILRAVRDREAHGGIGFLQWLQDRDLGKTWAYNLIRLADSADTLLAEGTLDAASLNNFSKAAFIETAKADPAVQQLVGEVAKDGDRLTQREVRELSEGWTAMQSELLPLEIVEKAHAGELPPPCLAPLVEELEKLPAPQVESVQMELQELPEITPEAVAEVTASARCLSDYWGAVARVRALDRAEVPVEPALEEALDLGCLSATTELIEQAAALEQLVRKLHATQQRLGDLHARLAEQTTAADTPLHALLTAIAPLAAGAVTVPLGEATELQLQLQERSI